MKHFQTYQVFPKIPESLSFLETLSRNLWWCWRHQASDLFRRIDPQKWAAAGGNPITFLTTISQKRLEKLAQDESFLAHQRVVELDFENRVNTAVADLEMPFGPRETIAYCSMEFGLHESIPIFAGGLGILAGDHLKAASSMGLPLTGVSLLYREGYFRQYLSPDGTQQEQYPEMDLYQIPLERARDAKGDELRVTVSSGEAIIHATVWKMQVGRIPLYLLDTNVLDNPPALRDTTARLYAGDEKIRLAQEVLLGVGGMRALTAMGIYPKICHMNEGHSAFSALERLAMTVENHQVDLATALQIVPRTTIFTTHTPVAAGHDEFPPEMVLPYLKPFEERLGIAVEEIIAWGQAVESGPESPFSMFTFGLRLSQHCNGVSRLHGRVARRMWSHVWPDRPESEIPIGHITNGVHTSSFISREYALLFDRYLGPQWHMGSRRADLIDRIEDIFDEELWRAHEMNRARLIRKCRERLVEQYSRRNAPKATIEAAAAVLDPDVLTIGFARRFATYKRAFLILQAPERLEALLGSGDQPIQLIFAGKAHPRDNEGKDLIRQIVQFARKPEARTKIVFLEDYDMQLGRLMVQGCDIWLNNPRRPLEACGTSGMKAAMNGVLNVSVLDGWWDEAYDPAYGWRIGQGEEYEDPAYQDAVESQDLYNILENGVIPTFYERKNGEPPGRWITMMKASMKMALKQFCAFRMVSEYTTRYYQPGALRSEELLADQAAEALRLKDQRARLKALWSQIKVEPPVKKSYGPYRVGDELHISSQIDLGELAPDEVEVELFYGHLKSPEQVKTSSLAPMGVAEYLGEGIYRYDCHIACENAGRFGFTTRVTPKGDQFLKTTPGLITWA
ncbi:MAG: alpha-glucan family phosphorylase [Desulfobacterales bacterium]